MRRTFFNLWSALTAAGGASAAFLVSENAITANSRLIPVLVGGNALTFTPNSITANPGDVIQFEFAARNHTVTQSDSTTPCQPMSAAAGVHSGFIPFDGGASGMVGTFVMPVVDTNPMFLYCAQANHCQEGMVMVINGNSSDLIAYANTAASATSNVPASKVAGGFAAQIPLANAFVPTAAASASSSASSSSATSRATGGGGGATGGGATGGGSGATGAAGATGGGGGAATSTESTKTITAGGGGTATATAFVTVGVAGGATTAYATTVVGPSGIAATTGSRATNGLSVNGTLAQPAVFTGGAMGRGKEWRDILVVAGAMALGTVLITARR